MAVKKGWASGSYVTVMLPPRPCEPSKPFRPLVPSLPWVFQYLRSRPVPRGRPVPRILQSLHEPSLSAHPLGDPPGTAVVFLLPIHSLEGEGARRIATRHGFRLAARLPHFLHRGHSSRRFRSSRFRPRRDYWDRWSPWHRSHRPFRRCRSDRWRPLLPEKFEMNL
jgi:hypothetical protein